MSKELYMHRGTDGRIINFEGRNPHKASEVICIQCGKRWISARPQETLLIVLECPGCHIQGFVIETGEELPE